MISVVICTHNRVDCLEAAVRSVFDQSSKAPPRELIVVDNASDDGTAELLDRLVDDGPADLHFRVLQERQLGLSWARNAGIAAAAGTAIAFLDDDAIAHPQWLEGVARGFSRSPDIAVVCGPIEPIWPKPRPFWLDDSIWSYYTVLDYGDEPILLDVATHHFAGANLSFRLDALRAAGEFPTHLGRKGSMLLSNEDRDVVQRVAQRGGAIAYEPLAHVRHHVHADRMSLRWIFRRAHWQGVSDALAGAPTDDAEAVLEQLRAHPGRNDAMVATRVARSWVRRSITRRTLQVPIKTLVNQVSQRSAAHARRLLADV